VVIENAWSEPHAIFGAEEASLPTWPWMHLDWKLPSRVNSDRFEKELLQEKPEKPRPPKELKEPVGRVDQSKPDCWLWEQLLLVLEGLEKLLASPQLSPAACCASKAVPKTEAAKVVFMLMILMNGKGTERENRCYQREFASKLDWKWTKDFCSTSDGKQTTKEEEDAEMKLLTPKAALCHYVDMSHRNTFWGQCLIWYGR
jgi:hypothetical protein